MAAVVLACRTYACPAVEVVLMIYPTNPNTHPSVDYNLLYAVLSVGRVEFKKA